jgi:hypothetical protein
MPLLPTINQIAKTINGPNDTTHISQEKIDELQDVKWGRLKSQEQAQLLLAASHVLALFHRNATAWAAQQAGAQAAAPSPPPHPPIPAEPRHTAPAAILPVCRLEAGDVLRLFRQFVDLNATQWTLGAGDHHHPMWELVAHHVEGDENKSGPDWAFIQPRNRKLHVVLLEEFVADPIKWDDRPFVPKYAVSNGIGYMLGEDGVWRDEDGNAATLEII